MPVMRVLRSDADAQSTSPARRGRRRARSAPERPKSDHAQTDADRRDRASGPPAGPTQLTAPDPADSTPATGSPQSGQVPLSEGQQLRMLERLRSAGQQPVTLDELRAGGVDFPAVVLSELEINGYVIERVREHGRLIGVRLLESAPPDAPASRWRQRRRRRSR